MNDYPSITSTSNPRIKELAKTKPSQELFIVEGYHLAEMAYEHGMLDELYIGEGVSVPFEGKKTFRASYEVIKKLSSSVTPEPVVGICHYNKPSISLYNRVVVLDRLQNPGNIGAILRCAVAFGFTDIFFLPGTCSPFNPKSIAASQGALFPLSIHFFGSEEEMLSKLKEEDVRIYGTSLRDSAPFEQYPFDPTEKMAFVLGNEGKGVSETLLAACDQRFRIKMEGIESLNVSVAAGILFHRVYAL